MLRFVADGKRRLESQEGLRYLGIPTESQEYLDLPDGELWAHEATISARVVAMVVARGIKRIITLGRAGYDGHPDHIATHMAAETAVKTLRVEHDVQVEHIALNAHHEGEYKIAVTAQSQERKFGALACHQSQFRVQLLAGTTYEKHSEIAGWSVEEDFWSSFSLYHPLILKAETYDRL
jgi:LmbE family N-acetylglucosaminyl deacetylase